MPSDPARIMDEGGVPPWRLMEFQDLEIWSQDPDFGVQNPEFGTYGVWGGQHMGKHMHTLEQASPRGLMDEGGVQARRAPTSTIFPPKLWMRGGVTGQRLMEVPNFHNWGGGGVWGVMESYSITRVWSSPPIVSTTKSSKPSGPLIPVVILI